MISKYLVQSKFDDGEIGISLLTAEEIISRVSMSDCSDEKVLVYDVSSYGTVKQIEVLGTWHNPKDPLYIKAIDKSGNVVFDGYGEDH
jgi:hypothetical protein